MSVYKSRDKWRAEVYFKGKRIKGEGGFRNKTEAKKWHDTVLGALLNGGEIELPPQGLQGSFDDLLSRFEEIHLKTIRKGTADRYLIDINYRIKPYFQYRELEQINKIQIEQFKTELLETVSVKSANNCIALLKTILNKGVEWGFVSKNPAADISLLKVPKVKYKWWDKEEYIVAFLAAAETNRYYLAFRLALDLGMRLGEIIGLSKNDVNLGRCQIHIHRQWLDKEQKYGPTKQNRERFISYSAESDLGFLLEKAINQSVHEEAIFTTSSGRRLGARKLSGYHFKRLIKLAKIPEIRFHDLRHTFASWFMIKSDDIWSLKGILGHADIQTTQRYAHLSSLHQKVPTFNWASKN